MECFELFYGLAATNSETQFRLGTNADVALAPADTESNE
jgi:hypothetical protein